MKIKANDYEPKYVMKMIREWTGLTQPQFGDSIYMSRGSIQNYEQGKKRYYFETLMRIAEVHGLEITIEKKEYVNVNSKCNNFSKKISTIEI